jgi:hypothetical protein
MKGVNPMHETSAEERMPSRLRECKTCLGEHDDEIHAATLHVHEWFHYQVVKNLEDGVADEACVA